MPTLLPALIVAFIATGSNAAYAGPYIAYVDKFFHCNSKEATGAMAMYATITPFDKKNPTELQRMTGNFTINGSRGMDNNYWARVRMDQKRSSGWKDKVINVHIPSGACSGLRENCPDVWRIFLGQDPGAMAEPCVTKAKWTSPFVNEPVNWTFPRVPVVPYGHWRFNVKLGRAQDTHYCMNALVHTIPAASTSAWG